MIKYFEKDFVKVYVSREDNYIYLEWQGNLVGDAYVQGVEAALHAGIEHDINKIVINDLSLGSIDMSARIKVMTDTAPNAYARFGRKKVFLAMISVSGSVTMMVGKTIVKGIQRFVPTLAVEYFDTKEKALEWIKKA